MKFMHISDLHLGSILNIGNNENKFIKEIEINSVNNAFSKAVSKAVENKVDFVIISGDIFDRDCYYVKAEKLFLDEVNKLGRADIPVYALHGNHDPMANLKNIYDIPENLHIFPFENPAIFEIKDAGGNVVCRIIGQSYGRKEEGRKLYKAFSIEEPSFNIGVLHTSLNSNDKKYIPCSPLDLSEVSGIDYWALGHIHKNNIVKENNPCIVYPGNPQGRDFGETGLRGCYIVTVEDGKISCEFTPLGDYMYKEIEINIGEYNLNNVSDLTEVLREKISSLTKAPLGHIILGYITRFTIKGRGKINSLLRENKEDIEKDILDTLNGEYENMTPFVHTEEVNINTSSELNMEGENEIYKGIDEIINKIYSDDKAKQELLESLGRIYDIKGEDEENEDTKIKTDDYFIHNMLNGAKELIIEKYMERGDKDEV